MTIANGQFRQQSKPSVSSILISYPDTNETMTSELLIYLLGFHF